MPACVHEWASSLRRTIDNSPQLYVLFGEAQFSFGDSADIQEVIDQSDHRPHLAVDDVSGLLDDRVGRPHLPQNVYGVDDGREGASKFMRKQGHEFFLAS